MRTREELERLGYLGSCLRSATRMALEAEGAEHEVYQRRVEAYRAELAALGAGDDAGERAA